MNSSATGVLLIRGIPSFQLRPADTPINTYFGDPDNSHVRANVHLASTTIDHQSDVSVSATARTFGDYDRFYQNYVPGAVTSDKTKVALSSYNNATKRRNLFQSNDATFRVSTGASNIMFFLALSWAGN
jgi:hypothetical protein